MYDILFLERRAGFCLNMAEMKAKRIWSELGTFETGHSRPGTTYRIVTDGKGCYRLGRKIMTDVEVFRWYAKNQKRFTGGECATVTAWGKFLKRIAAKLD